MPSTYLCARQYHFPIYVWIRKLVSQDLKPTIEIIESIEDKNLLSEREIHHIALLRSKNARLLNVTAGGEGQLGRVVPPEIRARLRALNLGKSKPHSLETKMKISQANKNRPGRIWTQEQKDIAALKRKNRIRKPHSEYTREKIRQKRLGSKQSQDSIDKMLLTRSQNNWTPSMKNEESKKKNVATKIKNGITKRIIDQNNTIYPSIAEAARQTAISAGGIVYSLKSGKEVRGYLFKHLKLNGELR
jgi:hypothetical protein